MTLKILSALLILAASLTAHASITDKADKAFHSQGNSQPNRIFMPDKSTDENLQALIKSTVKKFSVKVFSDDVTNLTLRYNLYLPENYSHAKKYPVVFFIADASSAGKAPEFSLTQGYGGVIWASDEEQAKHECIVIIPTYPGVILDDHNGFVTTDYIDLTARFVRYAMKIYSIDEDRVYVTGQSMGCMTFLILVAKYPELFTAAMFVSGQWDINQLSGLVNEKFIYIASNGDDKASTGQREVREMFSDREIPFVFYSDINAKYPVISISQEQPVNFITFKAGTTLPDGADRVYSEHMTSFDYAYRISALRDWLFAQTR